MFTDPSGHAVDASGDGGGGGGSYPVYQPLGEGGEVIPLDVVDYFLSGRSADNWILRGRSNISEAYQYYRDARYRGEPIYEKMYGSFANYVAHQEMTYRISMLAAGMTAPLNNAPPQLSGEAGKPTFITPEQGEEMLRALHEERGISPSSPISRGDTDMFGSYLEGKQNNPEWREFMLYRFGEKVGWKYGSTEEELLETFTIPSTDPRAAEWGTSFIRPRFEVLWQFYTENERLERFLRFLEEHPNMR